MTKQFLIKNNSDEDRFLSLDLKSDEIITDEFDIYIYKDIDLDLINVYSNKPKPDKIKTSLIRLVWKYDVSIKDIFYKHFDLEDKNPTQLEKLLDISVKVIDDLSNQIHNKYFKLPSEYIIVKEKGEKIDTIIPSSYFSSNQYISNIVDLPYMIKDMMNTELEFNVPAKCEIVLSIYTM